MDGFVLLMLFTKNTRLMKTLKERYEDICTEYVLKFLKKQGFYTKEDGYYPYDWIANEVGSILSVNDDSYVFSMNEIRIDIDENIRKGTIIKFYNYTVDNQRCINYQSYLKGLR